MSPKKSALSGLSVADLLKLQKDTGAERAAADSDYRDQLLGIQAELDKRAAAGEPLVEVVAGTEE